MGKGSKALKAFIANLPDSKVTGLTTTANTIIYKDEDFRLDMQGVGEVPWNVNLGCQMLIVETDGWKGNQAQPSGSGQQRNFHLDFEEACIANRIHCSRS